MLVTYGSLRSRLPSSSFFVASAAGGSIPSGQYNIRIQGRSRAGRNLLSESISVTCAANSKLMITLSPSVRQTGEDLFKVTFSCETTGNAIDARLLAEWEAREADQIAFKSLPATIEITQLNPTGELVYLASTQDAGGCDREITDLGNNPIISPPPYQGGNARGMPITMWASNGLIEDGSADEVQGSTLFLNVAVNGLTADENGNPYALRFKDKLIIRIEGLVRRSTGEINTSIAGVGETLWDGASPVTMPVPIPAGYAIAISLILKFNTISLPKGAGFAIYPESQPPYGKPTGSFALGDFVADVGEQALVLPERGGAWRRLSGIVTVAGYESPPFGEAIFTGLLADTANQLLAINAQIGGDMFVRIGAVETMEAIRAVASTVGGTYRAIATQSINLSAIGSIQVSIDYPCDSSGRGIIRNDYPDYKIAGNSKAAFNPPRLKIWVEFGGGIFELPNLISVTPAPTQTFLIDTLAGAVQVASIPSVAQANFCLFDYDAIVGVAVAGVGQLSPGTYKVWTAYHYSERNREITALNHSAPGCLKEITDQSNAETLAHNPASYYLNRNNHTGTQAIATIALLQSALDSLQAKIDSLTALKQDAAQILGALTGLTTDGLVRKTASALSTVGITPAGVSLLGATLSEQKTILGISGSSASSNASTLNGQAPSYYLDRANHTGTQAIATIANLQAALDNRQPLATFLTSLSNLTGSSNGLLNKSGTGVSTVSISTFAQGLLTVADAAGFRQSLQLGSAALSNSTAFDAAGTATNVIANHLSTHTHATSADQIGGLLATGNLYGITDPAQARTNLGLGSAAIQNTEAFDLAGSATNAVTNHLFTHTHATSADQIGGLLAANNLSGVTDVAQARTNLGLGTAATQNTEAFDLTGSATNAIANHVATYHAGGSTGGGSTEGSLLSANNLSDLVNIATARTNLGLGTAATQNNEAFDLAGSATNAVTNHLFTHTHATSADQIGGLLAAGNLYGITDATQARYNLGLGTAATQNTEAFDLAGSATNAVANHLVTHTHATSASQIGGLLAVSNLSDLTDAAQARVNLGVDTSQFTPISHTTTYGNGSHIPTAGITNTNVSSSAAIAFSKLSGVCATPTSGLLSARPTASIATNGRFYLATDQNGGTLYLGVSGAWVQCGKGVTQT